jgi:hypothetical protein
MPADVLLDFAAHCPSRAVGGHVPVEVAGEVVLPDLPDQVLVLVARKAGACLFQSE